MCTRGARPYESRHPVSRGGDPGALPSQPPSTETGATPHSRGPPVGYWSVTSACWISVAAPVFFPKGKSSEGGGGGRGATSELKPRGRAGAASRSRAPARWLFTAGVSGTRSPALLAVENRQDFNVCDAGACGAEMQEHLQHKAVTSALEMHSVEGGWRSTGQSGVVPTA